MHVKRAVRFVLQLMVVCGCWRHVYGFTHWVTTEDGRIQAQMDSVFTMQRPYDLIALMQQEKRVASVQQLRQQLLSHKAAIDTEADSAAAARDPPAVAPARDAVIDLENKIYTEDKHCLLAGQPLSEFNLFPSVAVNIFTDAGVDRQEVLDLDEPVNSSDMLLQPNCSHHVPMEFSMFAFEHLVGIKKRHSLSTPSDTFVAQLLRLIDNGGGETDASAAELSRRLLVFGHRVELSLRRRPGHWAVHQLATLYWRSMGDAPRALQCSRSAVYLAPRSVRHVAMLDMGVILHVGRHSHSAAIVLHAAVDHAQTVWQAHYTLGHVYLALSDWRRAAVCFNNTLNLLQPSQSPWRSAAARLNAVLCRQRVEAALETQHASLEHTLAELRDYQQQHEQYVHQQQLLAREQLPAASRLEAAVFYEKNRQLLLQHTSGDIAAATEDETTHDAECSRARWDDNLNTHSCDVSAGVKRTEDQLLTVGSLTSDPSAALVHPEKAQQSGGSSRGDHSTQSTHGERPSESPTKPPRFAHINQTQMDEFAVEHFVSEKQCVAAADKFADVKFFPSVYLAPESKGFDVSRLLTDVIGISASAQHPLPWYPPLCHPHLTTPPSHSSNQRSSHQLAEDVEALKLLRLPAKPTAEHTAPDTVALQALQRLVTRDGVNGDDAESWQQAPPPLAELGQRITASMQHWAVAGWISRTLATLYWRARGHITHAVQCGRAALQRVPAALADVPLLNLAAVMYRINDTQAALKLAQMAYKVNRAEPETNFLVASMSAARGHFDAAVRHFRRAQFVGGENMTDAARLSRIVRCHMYQLKRSDKATKRARHKTHCASQSASHADGNVPQCSIKHQQQQKQQPSSACERNLKSSGSIEQLVLDQLPGISADSMVCTSRCHGDAPACDEPQIACYRAHSHNGHLVLALHDQDEDDDGDDESHGSDKTESHDDARYHMLGKCQHNSGWTVTEDVEMIERVADVCRRHVSPSVDGAIGHFHCPTMNNDHTDDDRDQVDDQVDINTARVHSRHKAGTNEPRQKEATAFGRAQCGIACVLQKLVTSLDVPPSNSIDNFATQKRLIQLLSRSAFVSSSSAPSSSTQQQQQCDELGAGGRSAADSEDAVISPWPWHSVQRLESVLLNLPASEAPSVGKDGSRSAQLSCNIAGSISPLLSLLHLPTDDPLPVEPSAFHALPPHMMLSLISLVNPPALSPFHLGYRIAHALQQQNGSGWQFHWLAGAYMLTLGSRRHAENCFRTSLHLCPPTHRVVPLTSLASLFFSERRYVSGLVACSVAVSAAPYYYLSHFLMAQILQAIGESEESVRWYQSALSLNSHFLPASQRLSSLLCPK